MSRVQVRDGRHMVIYEQADVTAVPSSTSAVTLLPAGVRDAAYIENASTAVLFIKYGTGASETSRTTRIRPGQLYEFPQPIYCGVVTGAWASANGQANITAVS